MKDETGIGSEFWIQNQCCLDVLLLGFGILEREPYSLFIPSMKLEVVIDEISP